MRMGKRVVMTGKWLKEQKRWTTVVAMPENRRQRSDAPAGQGERKPPKPAKVLAYPARQVRRG
jgi:hypothetical protein